MLCLFLTFPPENAEKYDMAFGVFLTILMGSLTAPAALAARVVKVNQGPPFHVIFDNSLTPPFEIGTELCVRFDERRGICGAVFAKKGKYAAIRFRPGFTKFTRKVKMPAEALPPEILKQQKIALIRVW